MCFRRAILTLALAALAAIVGAALFASGPSPARAQSAFTISVTPGIDWLDVSLGDAGPNVVVYTLTWKSGGEDYVIQDSFGRSYSYFAALAPDSYRITGLSAGRTYTVRLQATVTTDDGLQTVYSNEATGTPTGSGDTGGDTGFINWARDSSKDFNSLSAAGNVDPRGVWSNGTTMYVADEIDDKFYAYNLSTRQRDSTKDFNLNPDSNWAKGAWSNGTTMWWADDLTNKIFAQPIGTGNRDTSKDITLHTDNHNPAGIWSNGATMWVADTDDDKLFAYGMSSRQRDAGKDIDLHADNADPDGIFSDGTTLWVADAADDRVYAYNIHLKARDYGKEVAIGALSSSTNTTPWGIWYDGANMWVTNDANNRMYAYTSLAVTGLRVGGRDRSPTSMDVFWKRVNGATEYEVQWKEASAATYPSANSGTTQNNFAIVPGSLGSITTGTDYNVRVRALKSGKTGPWTEDAVATPSSTALRLQVEGSRITARWNLHAGASACEHGTGGQLSATTCPSPHTTQRLRPGDIHTYRFRTHDSNSVDVKASAQTTLDQVAGLTATAGIGTLDLSWTASRSILGDNTPISYIVQWKQADEEFSTIRQDTATTNSYSLSGELGAAYTVRVRAVMLARPAAAGPWSDELTESTLNYPEIPDITWTRLSDTSIKVDWSTVPGTVTAHGVVWKTRGGADSAYSPTGVSTVGRSSTIIGLTANTDYTILVEAYGRVGGRTAILAQSVLDVTTRPPLPDVSVTRVGGSQLTVTWGEVANAATYWVHWKSGDQSYVNARRCGPIASSATRTCDITGLTAGTVYTIRIQAYDSGSVRIAQSETTGNPFGLTLEVLDSGNAVKVSWPALPSATSTTLFSLDLAVGGPFFQNTFTGLHTVTTYTASRLTVGREYTFRLTVSGGGISESIVVEASATPTLAKVTGLTATAGKSEIALNWNAVRDDDSGRNADGYIVQWKSGGGSYSTANQATPTTNSYTIPNLLGGLEYTVRVRATHATREAAAGPWSTEASATPAYEDVPNLRVSTTKTSLTVDWGAYTGGAGTLAGYVVRWKSGMESYSDTTRIVQLDSSNLTYTITGLTTGVTYTVRVEAFEDGGEGVRGAVLARSETSGVPSDKPGFTVNPVEITIDEGDSTTYTIKLKKKPARNVRILPTDRGSRFTVAPTSGAEVLTFTPDNWNTEQSVTLTAVEDNIPWRSADPVYAKWVVRGDPVYTALNFPPPVKITIHDNDTARIIVDFDYDTTGDQHSVNVEGGDCVQYRIKLASQPYQQARIIVYRAGDIYYSILSDLAGYDGPLITFSEHNWDDWRYVNVCADATESATTAYIYNKAEDSNYNERGQYQGVQAPALTLNISPGGNDPIPPRVVGNSALEPINALPAFDPGVDTALTLTENSPAGTNVGAPFTATDPDEGDTLTYTLTGEDAAKFAIDGSGQITTIEGVPYDYERRSYLANPSYSLAVSVSDGNGGGASMPITITLTDVADDPDENLPPEFHEGESTTREVAGGSPAGTKVGKPVTAFDANGDALMYIGFDGGDGAFFDLNDSGQITIKAGVTYDRSTYTPMLLVMETDTAELHMAGILVTISFTEAVAEDEEEEDGGTPQQPDNTPDSSSETDTSTDTTSDTTPDTAPTVTDTSRKFKTHYATVGQGFSLVLPAADADSGNGGPYTYALLNRTGGTAFGTNGLSFDATTRTLSGTPTAEATHELTYQVHDSDANTAASDAFVEATKLKIVVVSGGNAVGDDGGEPQESKSEPETPANTAPSFDASLVTTLSVDENSPAGTNVGAAIIASDPDTGDTLTYSLTGTDAASFTIGSSSGQIATKSGVTYNFEAKSSYSLTVNVSDGAGGTDSVAVTVSLNDVNEAPAFAASTAARSLPENSAAGTNVGSAVTATDPDTGDTLTYSLGGTDAASFAINSATGQISTASGASFDFETKTSYALIVSAADPDGLSDSVSVTVSVGDVAEPTASAGTDFDAKRGEEIDLNGSGTAHAEGSQTLTYLWTISDASDDELVTVAKTGFLTNATQAKATFTVMKKRDMTNRNVLNDGNWIEFTLTVTDGDGESHSDTVKLTIKGTTWKATVQ